MMDGASTQEELSSGVTELARTVDLLSGETSFPQEQLLASAFTGLSIMSMSHPLLGAFDGTTSNQRRRKGSRTVYSKNSYRCRHGSSSGSSAERSSCQD